MRVIQIKGEAKITTGMSMTDDLTSGKKVKKVTSTTTKYA